MCPFSNIIISCAMSGFLLARKIRARSRGSLFGNFFETRKVCVIVHTLYFSIVATLFFVTQLYQKTLLFNEIAEKDNMKKEVWSNGTGILHWGQGDSK